MWASSASCSRELGQCFAVHFDDWPVVPADNQQRGSLDERQGIAGQIRAAASGDDGAHAARSLGGGHQSRTAAGAGAEVTSGEIADRWTAAGPIGSGRQAIGKEPDIEAKVTCVLLLDLLLLGEQIE
jgi:hypothetical protein